jgi:anti-sigma-K factor RskA
MIDERQQELATLYALDLLEGAERDAFEAELREDGKLQALVRELREASATIALNAPLVSPSPELRARVLSSIAERPAQGEKVLFLRPAVFVPWMMAACLAIGCVWLSQLYLQSRASSSVLQDQNALAQVEIESAKNQLEAERIIANRQLSDATVELTQLNQQLLKSTEKIVEATRVLGDTFDQLDSAKAELNARQARVAELSDQLAAATDQAATLRERLQAEGDLAQFKIATLASMAGNSPEALAVAVWNPATQQGVLRVEKLPALASDKDYQVWLIDPAYPNPVDGGVFTVDPGTGHARVNFKPNQRVNNAAKFAVSLERKGGVPKPEGPIVLLGD